MYVKVNQGREGQDLLFEARNPIRSGFVIVDSADVDTSQGEPEWHDHLEGLIPHGDWYLADIFEQRVLPDEGLGYYIRYAWWPSDDSFSGVITSRNIFIMGDNGKTIDRVR